MAKKMFFLAVLSIALLLLGGCAAMNKVIYVPLPKDIVVVPPASDLPPQLIALSGKWVGRWFTQYGRKDFIFIVEEINLEKARIVYARGENEIDRAGNQPGWWRYTVSVQPFGNGSYRLGFPAANNQPGEFIFEMSRDCRLVAAQRHKMVFLQAICQRLD